MQPVFANNAALRRAFLGSLSAPRFGTYLSMAPGDERQAIALYHWNAQLSQALGTAIQAWEVCLRNRLDDLLQQKFGVNWPYNPKLHRQLKANDMKRLEEVIDRQERARTAPAPLSSIVAGLSAGFWVSLMTKYYDLSLSWRKSVYTVFPHDKNLSIGEIHIICDDALKLRNRIAHHEPILHLPLETLRREVGAVIKSMCLGTHAYVEETCKFGTVWSDRPTVPPADDAATKPASDLAAKATQPAGSR